MTELRAILPDRDRLRKRILVVVHELQMSRKNLSLSSFPLMNVFFSIRHLSSTAFFGRKQSRLNGILDSFQDLHAYFYACVILVKVCFCPLSKWEVTQVVSEPDGGQKLQRSLAEATSATPVVQAHGFAGLQATPASTTATFPAVHARCVRWTPGDEVAGFSGFRVKPGMSGGKLVYPP